MKRSKQDSSPSEGDEASRRRNRRQALALGGAAAAAAAVAALGPSGGRKGHAAAGDPLTLGVWNDAQEQATSLTASVGGAPETGPNTLQVFNTSEDGEGGGAVNAHSRTGAGVIGTTFGETGGTGVVGTSYFPPGPSVPPQEWQPGPRPGVYGGSGSGPGVVGDSESGPGVLAFSRSDDPSQAAVRGHSLSADPKGPFAGPAIGVEGISFDGPGVHGNSLHGPGVVGESGTASGVRGRSSSAAGGAGVKGTTTAVTPPSPIPNKPIYGVAGASLKPGAEWKGGMPSPDDLGDGRGVWGVSGAGIGVRGDSLGVAGVWGSAPEEHPGVLAFSGNLFDAPFPDPDGGLALDVKGKARFSTAGAGVVAAQAGSAVVANPAVTPDSHITITPTGDPGNAAAVVQWVERQPGSGFVVHMRVPVSIETPFTYLIVEPGM